MKRDTIPKIEDTIKKPIELITMMTISEIDIEEIIIIEIRIEEVTERMIAEEGIIDILIEIILTTEIQTIDEIMQEQEIIDFQRKKGLKVLDDYRLLNRTIKHLLSNNNLSYF
jgi:hypothetical protein